LLGSKAKIIVEQANGPITPKADAILFQNKVHVIPDFLANVGGVTVSHFEMVQNIMRCCWSFEEVYQKLGERMTIAYQGVLAASPQEVQYQHAPGSLYPAVARATDHLDFSDSISVHSILPLQGKMVSIVVHFVLRPARHCVPSGC
jgi:glutamate dehydrogenase/leucine dehydrogenase